MQCSAVQCSGADSVKISHRQSLYVTNSLCPPQTLFFSWLVTWPNYAWFMSRFVWRFDQKIYNCPSARNPLPHFVDPWLYLVRGPIHSLATAQALGPSPPSNNLYCFHLCLFLLFSPLFFSFFLSFISFFSFSFYFSVSLSFSFSCCCSYSEKRRKRKIYVSW